MENRILVTKYWGWEEDDVLVTLLSLEHNTHHLQCKEEVAYLGSHSRPLVEWLQGRRPGGRIWQGKGPHLLVAMKQTEKRGAQEGDMSF